MKIAFSLLLIIALLMAAALWLQPASRDVPDEQRLPWQVEALPDGSARVFGLTLGRDTLGEARAVLGPDMELAIVARGEEAGSLEMYYSRFSAGMLSGRLILVGELDEAALVRLREHSGAPRYLDSGARKYHLQTEDLPEGYAAPVQSLTFVPVARIDGEIARQRFGEPAESVRTGEQTVHLLYPRLGLDLMINEDHRDVLQYVAPRDFDRLRLPLLEQRLPVEKTQS